MTEEKELCLEKPLEPAELNHFDQKGNAVMVDVGAKESTARTATAKGRISVNRQVMAAITGGSAASLSPGYAAVDGDQGHGQQQDDDGR